MIGKHFLGRLARHRRACGVALAAPTAVRIGLGKARLAGVEPAAVSRAQDHNVGSMWHARRKAREIKSPVADFEGLRS